MATSTVTAFLSLVAGTCAVLQLLHAMNFTGDTLWPNSTIAVDFTVYAPIMVLKIGLVDSDTAGVHNLLRASIFDRSVGSVLSQVAAVIGSRRVDDGNPFIFSDAMVRLDPGVYTLVSTGFSQDRIISNYIYTAYPDSTPVLLTAALVGTTSSISSPLTIDTVGPGRFRVGATFTFELAPVPTVAPSMPETDFPDCEAVACADLPSGIYNVQGRSRFCDNDNDGGGWVRVWRANDSSCEVNGWTSSRRLDGKGSDRVGCRPAIDSVSKCSNAVRIEAPFPFRDVRGAHWHLWGVGSLDAFDSPVLCDGAIVWGGNGDFVDTIVWAFALSAAETKGRCPCKPDFNRSASPDASLTAIGPNWSCASFPMTSTFWNSAFDNANGDNCTGTAALDSGAFRRAFGEYLTTLTVGLCRNGNESFEEVKLASGDLFVRATTGFDKDVDCPVQTRPSQVSPTQTQTNLNLDSQNNDSRAEISTNKSDTPPTLSVAAVAGGASAAAAVVLIAVVVVMIVCWKRRTNKGDASSVAPVVANEYGVVPAGALNNREQELSLYDDVAAVRQ
jgi:hypothetical protein